MYLGNKSFKIISKKGQELSKSRKQSTNNVFRGSNATSHVRVISSEKEMTNKCPLDVFKGLEARRKVRMRFLKLKQQHERLT